MELLGELLPALLGGAAMTVVLIVPIAVAGVGLSFLAGIASVMKLRVVRILAGAYVEIFRGTSALVQIFYLFYVLPLFGVTLDPIPVGVLALSLNFGAYGSQIIRSSVRNVDRGQWEAATAIGLTYVQTLVRIVLPQSLVSMLPPFGNLLIEYLKLTSLLSVISITELTFAGRLLLRTTGEAFAIWGIVLVLYLVLAFPLTAAVSRLERRVGIGMRLGRG